MKDIIAAITKFKETLTISIVSKYFQKKIKLQIKYRAVKRNPLVIIVIAVILFSLFIIILQLYPEWQVARFELNNTTMVAQLENSYRATLAQMIGGFALLLGLYFTWKNVLTAKESQITELFTRAIEQLGNEKLEVRLGGIYALERISTQSQYFAKNFSSHTFPYSFTSDTPPLT